MYFTFYFFLDVDFYLCSFSRYSSYENYGVETGIIRLAITVTSSIITFHYGIRNSVLYGNGDGDGVVSCHSSITMVWCSIACPSWLFSVAWRWCIVMAMVCHNHGVISAFYCFLLPDGWSH